MSRDGFVLFCSNIRQMTVKSGFEVILGFTNILDTTSAASNKIDEVLGITIDILENCESLASGTTMERCSAEDIVTSFARFVARGASTGYRGIGGKGFQSCRHKEVSKVFGTAKSQHWRIRDGILKFGG